MHTYRIAAIPADGIGKEIIPAGIWVLKTLEEVAGTFRMTFETFPLGQRLPPQPRAAHARRRPRNSEGL